MAGGVIVAGKQNSARKQPPECVSASPDEQLTLESWPFFFTKRNHDRINSWLSLGIILVLIAPYQ